MSEEAARWLKRLGLIAAALAGGWLLWGTLTGALTYGRVGPRPSVGRKVVILLHGYGAPGDDLEGLAEELSVALPQVSFLVPEGPHRAGVGGRAWIPSYSSPSREEYVVRLAAELESTSASVWKLIQQVRSKGVRCEDLVIGGFSQGGRMAAEAALRAPADCQLGGLVVMSGGGMNDAQLPTQPGAMRVLVTHGSSDTVVGMNVGLSLAQQLARQGHEVRWLAFPGQHQIPAVVREALVGFLRGEEVGAPVP